MSDFFNIYLSFEAAEEACKNGDYVQAAEQYWWTVQYFKHGEFPVYDSSLSKIATKAESQWKSIVKSKLPTIKLSTSFFLMGKQCVKQMWLQKHRGNEQIVFEQMQSAFSQGNNIGELARQAYPNGKDADETIFQNYSKDSLQAKSPIRIAELPIILRQYIWLKHTKKLIEEKEDIIYDAAFVHNDVFATIDMLEYTGEDYIVYELKTTEVIDGGYSFESAIQYYVINNNIPVKDYYIIYPNKNYVNELSLPLTELTTGNCETQKLFVKKSILKEVEELQKNIERNIKTFKKIIEKNRCPQLKMGNRCHKPYECAFIQYCSNRK